MTITKLETTLAECVAHVAARWPVGSEWFHAGHAGLGKVKVVRIMRHHNDTPETAGASPAVVDADGREWSCYCPGADLIPLPTAPK